jgi:hypothetical protein
VSYIRYALCLTEDRRLSVVLIRLDRGIVNFGFRGFYEVRLWGVIKKPLKRTPSLQTRRGSASTVVAPTWHGAWVYGFLAPPR